MLINWLDSERWYDLNETLSKKLNRPETEEVRVFAGLSIGLLEVLLGLIRLFPHRKLIAIDRKQSPFFEAIAIEASKQGLKVQDLSALQGEELSGFFKDNKRDLLLSLCSSADPCTSEIFDASRDYQKLSNDHRIFCIQTHHFWEEPLDSVKIGTREVHMFSYGAESCIGLMGKKLQIKDVLHPALDWSKSHLSDWIAFLSDCQQDRQKVESFEAQLRDHKLLKDNAHRFYDRSLLSFDKVDGSFLISELQKKFPDTQIETSSLCQWKTPRLWDYLLKRGFSETQLRGLLVIPLAEVSDQLATELQASYKNCLGRQGLTESIQP